MKAQDQLVIEDTFLKDEHGKPLEYRNRFETWDDAYHNLKAMGINEEEVIKRIGVKKDGK